MRWTHVWPTQQWAQRDRLKKLPTTMKQQAVYLAARSAMPPKHLNEQERQPCAQGTERAGLSPAMAACTETRGSQQRPLTCQHILKSFPEDSSQRTLLG